MLKYFLIKHSKPHKHLGKTTWLQQSNLFCQIIAPRLKVHLRSPNNSPSTIDPFFTTPFRPEQNWSPANTISHPRISFSAEDYTIRSRWIPPYVRTINYEVVFHDNKTTRSLIICGGKRKQNIAGVIIRPVRSIVSFNAYSCSLSAGRRAGRRCDPRRFETYYFSRSVVKGGV